MKRLEYSQAAQLDIVKISNYIAEKGPNGAVRFLDGLQAKIAYVAERPRMFALRREIGANIRAVPYKRYVIYFEELETEVRIVRVLHASQQQRRAFYARPGD